VSRARARPPRGAAPPARRTAWTRLLVPALLALHFSLLVWVASRNSLTFDEAFHVPAGMVALARADFSTSYAQPPLARAWYGAFALAAGARLPDVKSEVPGGERGLARAFLAANATRLTRVLVVTRLAAALLSVLLGLLIWRTARRWYGRTGGLLALAIWTFSPEALAHGALVGTDLPTAFVFFGGGLAGAAWLRTGRWRDWAVAALWVAAAFLVRFSAVQLVVSLAVLAGVLALSRRLRRPRAALIGLALLPLVALLALDAGDLFQGIGSPLGRVVFHSTTFQHLGRALPWLPTPLAVPALWGLDEITFLAQPGLKSSYLLGRVLWTHAWAYFPVAVAVKWPLGLLALIVLRAVHVARGARRAVREWTLLVPTAVVLLWSMASNLDYGVRYLLPMLPFLCVWAGGLAAPAFARRRARGWAIAAALCVAAEAAESLPALPFPLAFFNVFAGGPGRGDRIVNDSNVDWGQGLIALREEMARRGIRRIHLAYHGMVDPALYGIDEVPFRGGMPGPESDYFAVSSYFFVGLTARIVGPTGDTAPLAFDLHALDPASALARPAGCMYLFKLR